MRLDKHQQAFFALVKAGLWEQDVRLSPLEDVDFHAVYTLAEEQSVQGLVLQGIDSFRFQVSGFKIPQVLLLQWIGEVQMIEQQNLVMNDFVAKLIENLRKDDVNAIMVKGQGVAQCYERPLWRASGDVDLLLNAEDYERAKALLSPIAVSVNQEYSTFKHLGMMMSNGIEVELHGTLHTRLSRRIDGYLDTIQEDAFKNKQVRIWNNSDVEIPLPAPDDDIVFLFTHILHHFYIGGVGLRQVCDWCRLLWTYRDKLNVDLLEKRLKEMRLMSEWKAFASVAVDWLGLPMYAMPLYDSQFKGKGNRIIEFILESGNFGHNRKVGGGKISSALNKMKGFAGHGRMFPWDSVKFFPHFLGDGIKLASEQR